MFLSSGITFATIVGLIYAFGIPLDEIGYLFVVGIPTAVGFFTEYLHKYS